MLAGGEKGNLPVVATVFDKLNQVYKEYLETEQAYTLVLQVPLFYMFACAKNVIKKPIIIENI